MSAEILWPVNPDGLFRTLVDDNYTLMRPALVEEHSFSVHDEAGLRALPVGTRMRDTDAESLFYWELTERGWVYRQDEERGPSLAARYRWSVAHLGASDYAPFTILNPEVLGPLGNFGLEHGGGAVEERAVA